MILILILLVILGYSEGDEEYVIRPELLSHPNWELLDRGDDCGESLTNRIIGGERAQLAEYPWLALLGYIDDDGLDFLCGGSVISEKYVLTAAHCSSDIIEIPLRIVRLGEYDLKKEKDCEEQFCADAVQDINVEEEVCHELYNNDEKGNDICLIRLKKPIEFNDFVSPICLPTFKFMDSKYFEGNIVYTAGWGQINAVKEVYSDVPMSLRMRVVPHSHCAPKFKSLLTTITKQQICAGGEVGKDTCKGDSGGPLMKTCSVNTMPRYFIIGVTSFGVTNCSITNIPAVFTSVPKYMTWIFDNVHK